MGRGGKNMRNTLKAFPVFVWVWIVCTSLPAFSGEIYKVDLMWPKLEHPWYFYTPIGIAVDPSGNVYVADTGSDRIQKFDSNGNFLAKWGSFGTGDGQFHSPYGVAVDSSGNVYVYITQ
jgi:DNA-binding beta-propeller fold protein YncE